jgi:hypothetical protein
MCVCVGKLFVTKLCVKEWDLCVEELCEKELCVEDMCVKELCVKVLCVKKLCVCAKVVRENAAAPARCKRAIRASPMP